MEENEELKRENEGLRKKVDATAEERNAIELEYANKNLEEINSAYDVQLEENDELKKEVKGLLKRVTAIKEESNTIGKERDVMENERNELREKVAYLEKERSMLSWEDTDKEKGTTNKASKAFEPKKKGNNVDKKDKSISRENDVDADFPDPLVGKVVMRPAIQGVRKPMMETRLPKDRLEIMLEEMEEFRGELKSMRRAMESGGRHQGETQSRGLEPGEWPLPAPPRPSKKNTGIKVTNNVQLVPPRNGPIKTRKQEETEWMEIGKEGKIKKAQGKNLVEDIKTTPKISKLNRDRGEPQRKEEATKVVEEQNKSRIKDREGAVRE